MDPDVPSQERTQSVIEQPSCVSEKSRVRGVVNTPSESRNHHCQRKKYSLDVSMKDFIKRILQWEQESIRIERCSKTKPEMSQGR